MEIEVDENSVRLPSLPPGARALVVGASRGIGLAIARELARVESLGHLYLAARRPHQSSGIRALVESSRDRATALEIDLADETSVKAAAERVGGDAEHIDLIINCAGLLHDGDQLGPERKLEQVRPANLERLFRIHAVGPLLLAKHFQTLLPKRQRFVFASLSARVGSIGDNRLGGWYGYRVSKAAHNMAIKTLSIELARRSREALCVALHPGTVDTDLSRPFSQGVSAEKLFSPRRAARQLLAVIDSLDASHSGGFFAWDGSPIPW